GQIRGRESTGGDAVHLVGHDLFHDFERRLALIQVHLSRLLFSGRAQGCVVYVTLVGRGRRNALGRGEDAVLERDARRRVDHAATAREEVRAFVVADRGG